MGFILKRRTRDTADAIARDSEVLARMVEIFCAEKHPLGEKLPVVSGGRIGRYVNGMSLRLCVECRALVLYAVSKRIICPYDPKPSCKHCETHCYNEKRRTGIRDVMRFSGMQMIKKGRLGLIKKYFF